MVKSGLIELLSRGLLWGRVLFIALLMSSEDYGYAMLLVSAEALLGAFISYPQIKDLLMRQQVHIRELNNTALLFLIVLPVSAPCVALYFSNYLIAIAVLTGALFFGLAQVLLYLLRIDDMQRYNRRKISAACLSTAVFLIVLPAEPLLLPLVQISYCAVLATGFRADRRFSLKEISGVNLSRSQISTWTIFGTQALVSNASIYGTRLIAGATLGVVEAGTLTVNYMIASGVTFYFAAVMIYAEKELSKSLDRTDVWIQFRNVASTLAVLWGGLAVYGVIGWLVWAVAPVHILSTSLGSLDQSLLIIFFGLFALRAVVLVINPVVIGLGLRRFSLVASLLSGLLLLGFLFATWEIMTLNVLVWAMVAASTAQVAILVWALVR